MTDDGEAISGLTFEEYRSLVARSSDVITVVEADGTIKYQSPNSEHVKGWPPDELIGENILEYVHPDDRARVVERFTALTEGAGVIDDEIEFRFRTKADDWIWLAVTGTAPEPDSPIDGFITTSRDITERKRYEQRLERYKQLVENVPVGIYRNTPGESGEFVEVNPAMVRMFDADSAEHLLEQSVRDLYADPDERRAFSEQLEDEGVITEAELELETLSGGRFWGSVTAIESTDDGETYFDGVIQDITRRKESEQRLRDQRDDLETLNQVVRHDIRNDLQLIATYAEMLEDHVDDEGQEQLDTIQEGADNAVELTKTARDLTEVMLGSDRDPQPTPLGRTLSERIETIRSKYPDAVVTTVESLPSIDVLADELLGSVFGNLLKNAIQHNDADVPEVTVSADAGDEFATVRIADNGPGVSDERKDEIFGKGEKGLDSTGTGVGLYLVRSLVEIYGGRVWVEDNDPEGAVFVVELVRAD